MAFRGRRLAKLGATAPVRPRHGDFGWLATRGLSAAIAAAVLVAGGVGCASSLERRFQEHVDYLASDELQGRGVGSEGIERAADYIGEQFAAIGLEPAGEEGGYFQTFEMTLHRTLTDDTRLTFEGDPSQRRLGEDFIPFSFSSDDEFSGEVVFCGYGIEAPEKQHDDFVHLDVKGKVALMLAGEPPSWADENGYPSRYALLRDKVYNAKDRGAAAVLIVNPTPEDGERDRLTEFDRDSADEYGIPAFHISRAMADAQLQRGGAGSLTELQERLDAGSYASAALTGVRLDGRAVFRKEQAPTRNVLGVLRGEGPLANQFVVVGAHYDHLGIRKPMMRKFKAGKLVREVVRPQIHNGADDNASGTSGLIEVARMFAEGPRPKRSILFVAFTAEESGVHGSTYYIDHPSIPLDRTVAMLNMDMIGRMKPGSDRVEVFGVGCSEGFPEVLQEAAAKAGLTIVASQDPGGRSDHGPFVHAKIPSLHFFTGHHADYHKPSDDADRINARGGAKVASLVYDTAFALATAGGRPAFHVVKSSETQQPAGTPTYRVVMGLTPGYVDDGKTGMAVEAVSPDGPAETAGMKAGDRIIRIGGKEVANIYDYMAATRKNKPGDSVEVVVLRDGREMTLQVTLAPAR